MAMPPLLALPARPAEAVGEALGASSGDPVEAEVEGLQRRILVQGRGERLALRRARGRVHDRFACGCGVETLKSFSIYAFMSVRVIAQPCPSATSNRALLAIAGRTRHQALMCLNGWA